MNGPERDSREVDTAFEVLADRRRRLILHFFYTERVAAPIDELVAHVTRLEGSQDRPSENHSERVAVDLHHVHLPKFADAGLVEIDRRNDTVRYRGDPIVETCLDVLWGCDVPRTDGC
jgi:hypothetical protein